MGSFTQKAAFILKFRYYKKFCSWLRICRYKMSGMQIGENTQIPKIYTTWPHQVSIGNKCRLEHGIYFKFDGIWKKGPAINIKNNVFIGEGTEFNIRIGITIGNDTLVAAGCRFIDHDHGIAIGELMRTQHGPEAEIIIGNDVWLGCNVVVLKGVVVSDGAIVAAGAVVTKSIPTGEIWGGVPAKKIGLRS